MDKFLISKRPYAVDLDSFRSEWHEITWGGEPPANAPKGTWRNTIQAVWFRRRHGVTVACIGYLWNSGREQTTRALDMLRDHTDGRYGGTAEGRWDGDGYWGDVSLAEQEQHLAILRPMLAAFPAVPPGYDGWWTFAAPTPSGGTAPEEGS